MEPERAEFLVDHFSQELLSGHGDRFDKYDKKLFVCWCFFFFSFRNGNL